MERALTRLEIESQHAVGVSELERWHARLRGRHVDALALTLAVGAVPISIAIAESFLAIAILARLARYIRGEAELFLPRVFWYWLPWAGLELISLAASPDRAAGWSELRRLFLIAGLFFVM